MITTKEISELTGKRNVEIMDSIENLIRRCPFSWKYFSKDVYKSPTTNGGSKENPCFNCTLEGVKFYVDNSRKSPKLEPLLEWYNNQVKNNSEITILHSRFEDSFMEQLSQTLEPLGYELIRQKPVFDGEYRLDGYIEDLKLAIEYDEEQHFTTVNITKDEIRQKRTEKELDCKFVRANYKNTNAYNVGLVIREILTIVNNEQTYKQRILH